MLHEKPNESFHWKNKLDELGHLPGESDLDKSASWQKLHDRLRPKSSSKKPAWFWIAAAILLAVVLIPVIMSKQENQPAIVDKPESKQQSNMPSTASRDIPGDDTLIVKKKAIASSMNKKATKGINAEVDHISPVKISNDTSAPSPEIIIHSLQYPDTVSTVFVVPVKKKLRVVHINELGQPAAERVQYVKGSSSPLFQLKVQQDHISAFLPGRNASDDLVKIKLSPSN